VTADLIGFLTLGLLGGVGHCVGMCSPFVLFVSRRYGAGTATPAGGLRAQRRAALFAQLWYTLGRIVTYAVLGALAGAVGGLVVWAGALVGLRRAGFVLAGGLLVVWALAALAEVTFVAQASSPRSLGGFSFGRLVGRLKGRAPGHPFALGLLLGLLPCGFLYSAVVAAVARGSALHGAAAMALFGLGTAPALLGLSLADEFLARHRTFLNRLAHVFILVMGAMFLWRGLTG